MKKRNYIGGCRLTIWGVFEEEFSIFPQKRSLLSSCEKTMNNSPGKTKEKDPGIGKLEGHCFKTTEIYQLVGFRFPGFRFMNKPDKLAL